MPEAMPTELMRKRCAPQDQSSNADSHDILMTQGQLRLIVHTGHSTASVYVNNLGVKSLRRSSRELTDAAAALRSSAPGNDRTSRGKNYGKNGLLYMHGWQMNFDSDCQSYNIRLSNALKICINHIFAHSFLLPRDWTTATPFCSSINFTSTST